MNICSCLQDCLSKFRNKTPSPTYRQKESEEEALVAHSHEEPTLSDQIHSKIATKQVTTPEGSKQNVIPSYFQEEENTNIIQSDLLDIKLQLQTSNAPAIQAKNEPLRDIQDLIKEELEINPLEVMKTVQIQPEFKEDIQEASSSQINPFTFSINLDPLDPYYALIHQRTTKIGDYFSKTGTNIELTAPNNTNLQIFSIENKNVSTFAIKYQLKCDFSFYLSTTKNDKLQQSFSNVIGDLRVIEALKPNLTRNTISFKKMGSFEARGCHYLKYQNGSKRQHWQVYLNDTHQQQSGDFKQCEVFSIKNIRQTSHKELQISQYLQIDLKSINAGVMIGKLALQYKAYLNNLQTYLQTNYAQELV